MQAEQANKRAFGKTPQPEPPSNEEGIEATEEEQAQYELVVSRAVSFMHGDGQEGVLKTMSAAETPAQGIGMVTAQFARMAKKSAKEQGKDIDDEVLLNAGAEIVEDLSELGQEAGIFEFTDQEEAQEQTEEGLMWAMKYYGQEALGAGELDVGAAEQAMQQGLAQEQQNGKTQVANAVQQEMAGKPAQKPGLIGSVAGGQ